MHAHFLKYPTLTHTSERIMLTGKKKLVLDHLIVQKMDDKDSDEDVKSILMFGAQALFEDGETQASRDIHCMCSVVFIHIVLLKSHYRFRS